MLVSGSVEKRKLEIPSSSKSSHQFFEKTLVSFNLEAVDLRKREIGRYLSPTKNGGLMKMIFFMIFQAFGFLGVRNGI